MRALVCHGPRNVSVEPNAGAAYGYVSMGPYRGGQAELLRVPYADWNALTLPDDAREKQNDKEGKFGFGLIVSHELPLDQGPEGYQRFGDREDGWTQVVLHP